MGEVIQLQGDHRTKVMEFLTDKSKDKMGKYALAKDMIKVCLSRDIATRPPIKDSYSLILHRSTVSRQPSPLRLRPGNSERRVNLHHPPHHHYQPLRN